MSVIVDCGLHRHPFLWCQQHVVHRLETKRLQLLDHAHHHGARNSLPQFVTDCSSPLTFKTCLFSLSFESTNQTFDRVNRSCSCLGRLRTLLYFTTYCASLISVKLHYIALHDQSRRREEILFGETSKHNKQNTGQKRGQRSWFPSIHWHTRVDNSIWGILNMWAWSE